MCTTKRTNMLTTNHRLVYFLIVFSAIIVSVQSVDVSDVEPFAYTISQGLLKAKIEQNIFSIDCKKSACLANYFWFTGTYSNIGQTRFKYYVDGEAVPSIDMLYYPGHGIGIEDKQFPWSSQLFGRGATQGGVWNTLKIPFYKSLNVTAILPEKYENGPVYWFTIKGLHGTSQVVLGKTVPLQLPSNAKLKLYSNERIEMKPLEYLPLAKSPRSGAVLAVLLTVNSGNMNFLEGCIRAITNNGQQKSLIASGTEDYFMSAFYFNAGLYQFPDAGLTYMNYKDAFSAYKIHTEDPIVFKDNGLLLTWRNGDTNDPATGLKCSNENGTPNGDPQPSLVSSYTWVYEW